MKTIGPTTEAHQRHMDTMKRLTTRQQRADYIAGVRRAEGAFAAKWLADDFADWWAKGRESTPA